MQRHEQQHASGKQFNVEWISPIYDILNLIWARYYALNNFMKLRRVPKNNLKQVILNKYYQHIGLKIEQLHRYLQASNAVNALDSIFRFKEVRKGEIFP